MATGSTKLTIKPVKPADIPSEPDLISAGTQLVDSVSSWKQGKTYKKVVKTYTRPKSDDPTLWHCRVSEHSADEATFDEFWDKLGKNKAENEKEYVPEVNKVVKIKELSPTAAIWSMFYRFGGPLSPRVYTVLQVTHLDSTSPRTGTIVSIPIDLTAKEDTDLAKLEPKGVQGRYVSVEQLKELENGSTRWSMVTAGSAGGFLPQPLVEFSMDGKIAEDVPHFLGWLQGQRKKNSSS